MATSTNTKSTSVKSTAKTTTEKKAASDSPLRKKTISPRLAAQPVNGFVNFLREQAVVGLAIGLIIGTQAKDVVNTLTASFINPLAGLLIPGSGNLAAKQFAIHYGSKVGEFGWGAFASSLINFIIVAAVVYFVIKGLRLDKLDKKAGS
jgi:large conductance mechanosensitive channel